MSVSVKMPLLGESVTEGTVTRWLKNEGDPVSTDEPLVEVSTDKVDTEIPAPATGVLLRILAHVDETVAVGAELAVIGEANEAPLRSDAPEAEPTPDTAPTAADTDTPPPAAETAAPVQEPAPPPRPPSRPSSRWTPRPHPTRPRHRCLRAQRPTTAPGRPWCCRPSARASPRARSRGG